MKAKLILKTAGALLKAKILKRRSPAIVGWAITDLCNRRCLYCARWQGKQKELSTEEVFRVVDELARMGTAMISFTGGEPLVRKDIGKIIDYIYNKGISVKLNSNGMLVEQKIKELKKLDLLTLSLEGPEEIHDAIRGKDAYQQVLTAAQVANKSGIRVSFTTVLTADNLKSIDFILNKAKEFNSKVNFQPATQTILGSASVNPLAPDIAQYRQAINKLIERKKNGNKEIANSLKGLEHLYWWPEAKKMNCACSWVSCRIEPNGDIIYCSRGKTPRKALNCINDGVEKAFNNLSTMSCNDCWCATRVELNLAFSTHPSVIMNQVKSQGK